MVVRPAELPIGIVTSAVGVPVFIFLVAKKAVRFLNSLSLWERAGVRA